MAKGKRLIHQRTARAFIEAIRAEGCECIDVSVTGSGHVAYRVRHGAREQTFHGSRTPSDLNAHRQFARDIRRWRNREDTP